MNSKNDANQPDLNDFIDVGDYKLHYKSWGKGSPTVIFDSGVGDSGFEMLNIANKISEFTNVLCYDRLGLGKSDPFPKRTKIRTTQDMVTDLNTLVKNINIFKPFVYVAHSMAGFNARLYQDQFPEDIAGMVLIDVSHPDSFQRMEEILPPESNDSEKLKEYRNSTTLEDFIKLEFFDYEVSASQVRRTNQIEKIPVVVLSEIEKKDWEIPEEIIESYQNEWRKMQEDIVKLSSNSRHIVVPNSSHYIYEDQPEIVVNSILDVVEIVRGD